MLDLLKSISQEFLQAIKREIKRITRETDFTQHNIFVPDDDIKRSMLFLNAYESAGGEFSSEYRRGLEHQWNRWAFESQERLLHYAGIGGGGFSPYSSSH